MSSKSPRVLVVPSSYFASNRTVGGGERYALEYARALSVLTPTTLALFDITPASEWDGALEIRTFEVRETRDRILFPLKRDALRSILSFDVLHLMIYPTPLSDLLVAGARLMGRKVVLTDVGGGVPSVSTYLSRIHPALSVSRLADGLALLSAHSAGQYPGWGQPKVLLYGGTPVQDAVQAGEEGEEPYALFVGRLLPHKGVLELIEALDEQTPLRVLGRPYDAAYLQRLESAAAGKKVSFILDADERELTRQYLGARIVLQVSIPVAEGAADTSELLGLVALEGMAYGKPVIVTEAGSLPELVKDGVTGFIVPPGNRQALRSAIRRLMDDETLAKRMGEAARVEANERFAWTEVAKRGFDFYRQLQEPSPFGPRVQTENR